MRKIEYIARQLHETMNAYHPEVFRKTCQSVVVLAWALYQPTVAPSLEFLTTKKAKGLFGLSKAEQYTDEEKGWEALLDAYGYMWTDEFDLALVDGLRAGFFDPAVIRKYAGPMNEDINVGDAQEFFRQAWDLYHGSFDNDEEQVLDGIANALREKVRYVSLSGLSSVVTLFRDLGQVDRAIELIQFYVAARDEAASFWDLDRYAFGEAVSDPDVQSAVRAKYETFNIQRPNPVEMLHRLMGRDNFDADVVGILSTTSTDEFYRIFKTTKGKELRYMLDAVFKFRRIGNPSPEMIEIMTRSTAALKRIGTESTINARRVARYVDEDRRN